ncbi:hypothetical protein B296_00023424 [Ensete ventricosum]|uniref:Uncharacterized protein n=1 Tax=Ensete ventricosum TaxID=4639 RepID=A0A426ZY17_ENSVE|nr:hypothetical protein B296_00023424 [Ensete ventricosum]
MTGLFDEALGATLTGDAPTSRAADRVGGTLPPVTLGIPQSSPRSIWSAFRPTESPSVGRPRRSSPRTGMGGIVDRVSRPIKPEPPNRTTNIKVAGLPTFVTGRCPADSKTDPGGKVITAPTLAEAKARHEQVPSRDNPGSSALAQEDDKVTPRVGRYLVVRDSPPPQALLDEWVQRKLETGL